jgi:hypothetical protein
MSEECEPRWTVAVACRPTVFGEHPAHDVLVDLDTEYKVDLLRGAPVPNRGFRRFISTIAAISSGLGPFGDASCRPAARYSRAILPRQNEYLAVSVALRGAPGRLRFAFVPCPAMM